MDTSPDPQLVVVEKLPGEDLSRSLWRRRLTMGALVFLTLASLTIALAQRSINQRQSRNFAAQIELLQRDLRAVREQASADQIKLAALTRLEQRRERAPVQAARALQGAQLLAPKLAKASPVRR